MKGILGLLRHISKPEPGNEALDSKLFSTTFSGLGGEADMPVPWDARAIEVGAKPIDPVRGTRLLQDLWARDRQMSRMDKTDIGRMERFFDFATVAAKRDIIRQDEYGNFMVVLLNGGIAIDRVQPWGERLHLADATPGEILGEMSLLDSGMRFSICTTVTDCDIAILDAEAMNDMLRAEPALAANLVTQLARKLSLRLRIVSARLSDKK